MTKRIFRSICCVSLAVFLASLILIMGVLCATPLIRNYIVRCSRKKPEVTSAVLLLLGILSIAFLVYGTYNPFLYFRF